MNNKGKIILISILSLMVVAALIYKFVINKSIDDYNSQEAHISTQYDVLMGKLISGDTAYINAGIGKLWMVLGRVNNINNIDGMHSIELAPVGNQNTIIFQIDKRHISAMNSVKEGQNVSIKGLLSGYELDDDLGLGYTIHFKYASIVLDQ